MQDLRHHNAGVYRLSEAAVRRILLQQGCWTPDSLIYSLAFGLGLGLLGQAPLWPMVVTYALLSLLHLKSFRHLPRLKDGWRDFEVIVETDRVLERRNGSVECEVSRSEITKILELPIHGLWIHTSDSHKRIWAPSQLTGYKELRSTLTRWTTVQRQGPRQLWIYFGLPAALAIFASALLVRSRYVFFPLLAFAGFYLLRFAKTSIKTWTRPVDARRGIEDPFWVTAIPFVLLALLVLKLAWILFESA
jgi:hypothetical protein